MKKTLFCFLTITYYIILPTSPDGGIWKTYILKKYEGKKGQKVNDGERRRVSESGIAKR